MAEIIPPPESSEPEPVEAELTDDTGLEEEASTGTAGTSGLPTAVWSLLVLAAFAIGLAAGYLVWARPQQALLAAAEQRASEAEQKFAEAQAQAEAQTAGGQEENAQQQVQRYPVPEDDDYFYGPKDAPITIIEFSDYECPFCQRWHNEAWPQIKAKYGDQVRLVFRDFPLESIHPNATPAAEAANCAGEQGQYFAFNDLLFAGGKPLQASTYDTYAEQIGLDVDAFKACVDERRYAQEVQDDLNYAGALGVRSTPTFFINGLAVVGAQPFEVFDQIISMELAGEIPE